MRNDKPYNGIFMPDGSSGSGHINIAGRDTSLQLVTTGNWRLNDPEFQDFHGFLTNGTKASALQCVLRNRVRHFRGNPPYVEFTYFPHYVALGETYIGTDDSIINAIHYQFENADYVASGHRTFKSLLPTPEEAMKILEADYRRSSEIAKQHNWPEHPFEPEIGEQPELLYYSGVSEIAKATANLGTVSIGNAPSLTMGSSRGIWITNKSVI